MKCRAYAIGWISLDTSAKIAQPKQCLRTRLGGELYCFTYGKRFWKPPFGKLQCAFDFEQALKI